MCYQPFLLQRPKTQIVYSTLPNVFFQSSSSFSPTTFDINISLAIPSGDHALGSTTSWERLTSHLSTLHSSSPANITYKLIFLLRHGQGTHNVAESFYGTDAWDAYYSLLESPPDAPSSCSVSWSDPELTARGIKQAEALCGLWTRNQMPMPEGLYCSPLRRAIQTALIAFPDHRQQMRMVVKEGLRERMGMHTCDRRSDRSTLQAQFPAISFEEGFVEEDGLFRDDVRETDAQHDGRSRALLDEVFTANWDEEVGVAGLICHGGTIASILRVLGHKEVMVGTGGWMAALVRAERLVGEKETSVEVEEEEPNDQEERCVEGIHWHKRAWDQKAFWKAGDT